MAEIISTETDINFKVTRKRPETVELIESAVKNNLLFEMVSIPARRAIINSMWPMDADPGKLIIRQGDVGGDKFFVLESGTCEITIEDPEKATKKFNLEAGSAFGEIALLYNTPRSATIRARTPCRLWCMERKVYKAIITANARRIQEEIYMLMETIPTLSILSEKQRMTLAESMEAVEFEDGEVIFRKGDRGDRFFLLKEGTVNIKVDGKTVSRISPGYGFGERALEGDSLRTADAVCEGYVVCFTMFKDAFDRLIGPMHNIWRYEALRRVNILAELADEQVMELVNRMSERSFKAGETIFKMGDEGDYFYIIDDGELRICDENDVDYARVFKGSCFGELALLTNEKRTASVVALTDGKLMCVHRNVFNEMLANLEGTRLMWRIEALLRVPVLRALSHAEVLRLAQHLEQEVYQEGDIIIREGEEGNKMYIVESGMVAVLDSQGNETRRLGGGTYFGELALLYNIPRSATIKAVCYMSVLSLTSDLAGELLEPARRMLEMNIKQYNFPKAFGFRPLALDDFQKIGVLGLGAFGVVYLVRHQDKYYAMKKMSKARIKSVGLVRHVEREKDIMLECNTPFVVNLISTFDDRSSIYIVMETVMGGELFTFLQSRTYPLSEASARFYAGCVVLALEYFAKRSIVYRDLKPENLLIAENGYLKVADYGFAKKLWRGMTYTMCGTPDYMAPEMISHTGHTRSTDIWALAVLIYEMVVGITPFYNPDNNIDTFRRIIQCNMNIPPHVSSTCGDLLKAIMIPNPTKRLGMGKDGMKEIKDHPWFDGFDWKALEEQTMKAPYIPKVSKPDDMRNFDQISSRDPRLREDEMDRNYESDGSFANF